MESTIAVDVEGGVSSVLLTSSVTATNDALLARTFASIAGRCDHAVYYRSVKRSATAKSAIQRLGECWRKPLPPACQWTGPDSTTSPLRPGRDQVAFLYANRNAYRSTFQSEKRLSSHTGGSWTSFFYTLDMRDSSAFLSSLP